MIRMGKARLHEESKYGDMIVTIDTTLNVVEKSYGVYNEVMVNRERYHFTDGCPEDEILETSDAYDMYVNLPTETAIGKYRMGNEALTWITPLTEVQNA